MKSIKRIVLAAIFAIGAIILVACSGAAKSDNGTYVYEASKDFIKNTLKEQGASSEEAEKYADQFSLKMTIEIKDTKGKVTLEDCQSSFVSLTRFQLRKIQCQHIAFNFVLNFVVATLF